MRTFKSYLSACILVFAAGFFFVIVVLAPADEVDAPAFPYLAEEVQP